MDSTDHVYIQRTGEEKGDTEKQMKLQRHSGIPNERMIQM